MAQPRKARPAAAKAAEVEEAPDFDEINAVVIKRVESEDGNIHVEVAAIGDVKATEVATIIELAVPQWRRQIGLLPPL